MTHLQTSDAHSSRRLAETTRALQSAIRLAQSCACGQARRIAVVHGPDQDSRNRAQDMRERLLTGLGDATVELECTDPTQEVAVESTHRCATVDARDRVTSRALIAYRWQPNQPDTGRLAVTMDGTAVAVHAGVGIEVRVADGGLGVWAIEDHHQRSARVGPAARRVEVRALDGMHLLYRDEVLVGDSPPLVRLVLDERGGVRRLG